MTIDIAEIRAAAEAAPKGAWRYEPCTQNVWSGNVHMVASIRGWGYFQYLPNGEALQDATGVHIATANPATVLAMCDEIERLRCEVNGLNAARIAYASEFPPNADGEADVGSIHQNIRAMRKDADRYRHVRDNPNHEIKWRKNRVAFVPRFTNYEYDTFKTLDEAVDAAIDKAMEAKT